MASEAPFVIVHIWIDFIIGGFQLGCILILGERGYMAD
jgi:hypothetical protein